MAIEAEALSDNNSKKIQIGKILVPIDGSEYSLNAAKYAIRIAKDEKADLFCIHVITPQIPYGYATAAASTRGQNHEEIKDKVESWFDKVKDMAKVEDVADVKTEIFIDVKSVIESIIDYASRKNIDLIVIGTRGRTGLKRFLMGSVANGVVQHAHCPVLLVR
jgi:nucleotide-binding universal stress UspA family protein